MILKNVAGQRLGVFAYDSTTGAAKTGDAGNITAYISLDFAAPAQTNDVNPTELDAVNAPGWYVFELAQGETNAEVIVLAPVSATADILIEQVQLVTQDASISSRATQASVDALNDLDAAGVRTAVGLAAANLDTQIGTLATGASIAALNDLSADDVWDELIAAHLGIGSTGAALNAAGAAGDPWASLLPAAYGAGTAGNIVGNIIARVWAYASRTLTQSAASVAEAVQGSTLTIHRGDTVTATLTGLGSLADYVSLDFTVKVRRSDSDDDAIIRIRKNLSGVGGGLLRFNKAQALTPANGSITIDDLATGDVTIVLAEEETDDLAVYTGYHYDIQMITATGVHTLTEGYCHVVADVTRLIA